MTALAQYIHGPANADQFCQLWSDRVDALERHLSAKMWAVTIAAVVLVTYPIAQMVIPAVIHAVVPDVVRTVLSLIGV
jgi:hypothetical protein